MNENGFIRELDGGLILRRSNIRDAARLAEFNAKIHAEDPYDAQALTGWTIDLLTQPHPTFRPDDFTIVENPATGEIVSTLCTISQTWQYETISFGVGRPELVGTLPAYRKRGLIRAQFDVVHEWSRERGELLQFITGIPFYYRQFGYEMALELSGGRGGYEANVPALPDGQEEKYTFRPVTEADIPLLMALHAQECRQSEVSVVRGEKEWRNELFEKSAENVNRLEFRIIQTREGQPVGYLAHPWFVWGKMQALFRYELFKGVSYLDVTPAVIRYLWKTGEENAARREKSLNSFGFWFGSAHPAYKAAESRLVFERKPYAFYIRVPDLPAFLRRISPVLEARLADSVCAGHSGELKISFYRQGIHIVFEEGRITGVNAWMPVITEDEGVAAFPNLTFLQLIFGFRSLEEIRNAFPDCSASEEARVLLDALFPKKPSSVWTIS